MATAIANRNVVPSRWITVFCTVCSLAMTLCISVLAHAQSADLVRTPVDPVKRVPLTGHHPTWANPKNDAGAVPADLPMERLTLVLARSPERERAYTQFLENQQNPASPDYHHWLTPAEIGRRFGASSHDIQAVTAWLESQSLRVDSISNSRERIVFSGPASAIATTFGAEMHYFTVAGEKRISITAEPQIPAALGNVVKSISGLYTVKLYPQHRSETVQVPLHNIVSDSRSSTEPEFTLSDGSHAITPADFATIYNVNGVTGGINGTGQTIAIVARSRVCTADITNFATQAAVTVNVPNAIVPPGGVDPGPANCGSSGASGDQGEATLDVTRAGSIAQGASLLLVASADTQTLDGIGVGVQYIVDTNPVPAQILNISFGGCESQAGQAGVNFWDSLFKQAAMEGLSVFVSSDDSGAAGCDQSFQTPPVNQILSPNVICSSGYATCVGGTEFADFTNPSLYWSPVNGNGFESALSYIPEGAWNEPMNGSKFQVAGTGGGVSKFVPTPSWQVGTGVPPARAGRYTPDVAFSASAHDGYFGCIAGNGGSCVVSNGQFLFVLFAGTSASAPDMAGIAALLNQKEGAAQGLLNPQLYSLAATPANNVFNDVTVSTSGVTNCVITTPSMCNNSTAGPTSLTGGLNGYLVNTGFDEATGLGSINVANLLANWVSTIVATTTKLSLAPASVTAGSAGPVVMTATVTSSGGTPTGDVNFFDGSSKLGAAALSNGTATFNYNPSTLTGGTYSITATYPWSSSFGNSSSVAQTLTVQDFKVTPNPATVTVTAPGQSGTTTLTITPLGGFTQTISFSCNQMTLPSEATCTFAAASATTETLTIATMAPSARLDKDPFGHRHMLLYALLLPGFLGLVVAAGNRKRTSRGARLLSFIAVLALSVLWMPGCGGGGNSTPSNPGTPAGSSTVTVTATSAGTPAISHPITITLTVQ